MHHELRLLPFRGSSAIERGLITRGALRGNAWRRLMSDVYINAAIEMDYRLWCYAVAQYVSPRGAIAGLSAAYLHGVDLRPAPVGLGGSGLGGSGLGGSGLGGPDLGVPDLGLPDLGLPVEAVLPTAVRKASAPQVKLVRSPLPPSHVSITSGVRATTPVRTAFDLGRHLSPVEAVIAIDVLCFRRVLALADLVTFASVHSSWPGGRRLAQVLDFAEPLSESPMETRLRLVIVGGGLPRPVAQHEVRVAGRFVARLDLAYPEWRIAIEYDGDHHRSREMFAADLRRQNRLLAAGWTILRFTAIDVYHKPDEICTMIRAIIPS